MSEGVPWILFRGTKYFVCEYTGAFITERYYLGKGRKKTGCYVTLPVMLRAILDNEGQAAFIKAKALAEEQYDQPDIPLQTALGAEHAPMSTARLCVYLREIELGENWQLVPGSQNIAHYAKVKRRKGGHGGL